MIFVEMNSITALFPCDLVLITWEQFKVGFLEKKNKSAHNLCILNAGRIYLWGLQATIYILVYVKDRKHKLVSGVADTAGRQAAAEGAGAGAQGQDEEINNPLIIQNSQWLQAIGKRFSDYLINC